MKINDKKLIDKYYKSFVEKDKQYEGIYYAAIKTTGIFCVSTCTARKSKLKNTEFYSDMKDCLREGYRPCKICKPTEKRGELPDYIKEAIEMVKANPMEKVKDYMLREAGIQPEKVRRWFKKNYDMTFHTYQRMLRVNSAYHELKENKEKVGNVAFDNGYESLSGFAYTFKKMTGYSPKDIDKKNVILIERIATPLGAMFVCASAKGICLLEFTDRRMLETEFEDLQKRGDAVILIGSNEHIEKLKIELNEYFEGERKEFTVELDMFGTEFQKSVWQVLQDIPYGEVWSYQQQAINLGNEKAVRAVGTANGKNKIAIIIPCHRVIGKDGSLTGYGGGLERKKWLLDFEKSKL